METQIPVSLIDAFKFLGSPVFIGIIISLLAEQVPAFQRLSASKKFAVVLLLCVVCAAGSFALVNYVPSALIEALQPWYAQIVTLIIAVVSSQVYHKRMHASGLVVIEAPPTEQKDEAING